MRELVWILLAAAAVIYLGVIAERLVEMQPTVQVQLIPVPESSGDKAAAGSE